MMKSRWISGMLVGLMLVSSPMVTMAETIYGDTYEQDYSEDANEIDCVLDINDEFFDEDMDEVVEDEFIFTGDLLAQEVRYIDDADIDPTQIIDPDIFLGVKKESQEGTDALEKDEIEADIYEDIPDVDEEFATYFGTSKWSKYANDYFYHKLPSDSYKKWWIAMQKVCDSYLDGTEYIKGEQTAFVSVIPNANMSVGLLTECFIYSNPQYYFLKNGTCVGSNCTGIIIYNEFADGATRKQCTDRMFSAVNSWLSQINGSTEADKLRKIHSLVCAKVSYNKAALDLLSRGEDPEFTQSAYSPFVLNKTVCAGYTMATTLLCNAVGIHAIGVTGYANGDHAWNKACVNGVWYNVDNTWDDKSTLSYTYFGRSDSKLASHTMSAKYNAYAPVCNTDSGATSSKVGFSASHSHSSSSLTKKNGIIPTCGEDGTNAYFYCNGCGKAYSNAAGTANYEIKAADLLVNKTAKHTWREGSTSSKNCEVAKTVNYTCTVCGATKKETIPAKSHNYVKSSTKNSTNCMTDGYQYYTCTVCNATKSEPIPARGYHDYVKDPNSTITNCLSSYYETYTCSVCGATKKEKVPARDSHDYVKDPIAIPYKCDEGHYETYTCSVCKKQKREYVWSKSHTWGNQEKVEATATEEGYVKTTCTVCGAVKKEPLDEWLDLKWQYQDGKYYWYENGIKQGTESDPKGIIGDGKNRGREIYDPEYERWCWLDACYDGAKACNKEVWVPYIYQEEDSLSDLQLRGQTCRSGDMADQVYNAVKNKTGKWVRYNSNGRMIKGWYTVSSSDAAYYPEQVGNTYYYDEITGLMAKGTTVIDGATYYFDPVTGVLQ